MPRFCPNCGMQVSDTAKFCGNCRNQLPISVNTYANQGQSSNSYQSTGGYGSSSAQNYANQGTGPATMIYKPGTGFILPLKPLDLQIFSENQLLIGRDPASHYHINHPAISWHHASLVRTPNGGWLLHDLHGTNPLKLFRKPAHTFIMSGNTNTSLPISQATLLKPGDKISLPPYTLTFTGTSLEPSSEIELIAKGLTQQVRIRGKSRKILDDVNLVIEPREFVAVLGGSGAGKSTLLRALSGYTRNLGTIWFNRNPYYENFDAFRGQVGFVPQSDIIHAELSVDAALHYAARLRLGEHYDRQSIDAKVKEVLKRLELTPHAQKRISQLSGGQRKRVSIAVELLTEPSLFFLDEPTSGLDPGLEAEMMQMLQGLAKKDNHTIILVTHSVVNISLCDKIAVMGVGGVLTYYGPPGNVGNPAIGTALGHFGVNDFADIYRVVQPTIVSDPQTPNRYKVKLPASCKNQYLLSIAQRLTHHDPKELLPMWTQELSKYFKNTKEANIVRSKIQDVANATANNQITRTQPTVTETRPVKNRINVHQTRILLSRYLDLKLSDLRALLLLLIQAPIIGLLLAFSVKHDVLDNSIPKNWPDAQRLLGMMACTVLWFGIFSSASEVIKELPIYQRERFVNLDIISYLSSKVIVLFMVCVVQCAVLLGTIATAGVDISGQGQILPLPIEMFIDLLLMALVGMSLGLLISSFVTSSDMVTNAMPIAMLPQIILNPTLLADPGALKPFVNILITSKWGLVALGNSTDITSRIQPNYTDIYSSDAWGLLFAWLILIANIAVYLTLAYFMLRLRDKKI